MPITGAEPEFNGLHPERVKELQNEGERQAEEQIEQPSAPFGRGMMMDEEPEEEGDDTLPLERPPAGLQHQNVHGQLPNLGPAYKGPVPKAHKASGGMNRHARRGGGSAFYGD